MEKYNCWEFKKCGREIGGTRAEKLGICPSSIESRANGVNEGINGGRACWAIAGTFCQEEIQGIFALDLGSCKQCDFHDLVKNEQGKDFQNSKEISDKLK